MTAILVAFVASLVAQSPTYEPKNWWGLLGLLIIAVPALAAGIPGWINLWHNRSVPSQVAEVREQVQTEHADRKLRDDLDRVLERLGDIGAKQDDHGRDIRGLRNDMGQMRGELRDERETRASADSAQAQGCAAIDAAMRLLQQRLDTPRTAARAPEES